MKVFDFLQVLQELASVSFNEVFTMTIGADGQQKNLMPVCVADVLATPVNASVLIPASKKNVNLKTSPLSPLVLSSKPTIHMAASKWTWARAI